MICVCQPSRYTVKIKCTSPAYEEQQRTSLLAQAGGERGAHVEFATTSYITPVLRDDAIASSDEEQPTIAADMNIGMTHKHRLLNDCAEKLRPFRRAILH